MKPPEYNPLSSFCSSILHVRTAKRCLVLITTLAAGSVQAQTTAVRVNDFLHSMGINTHISQGTDDPVKVVEMLKYTGIRNIRDGGGNTNGLIYVYQNTSVSGVRPGAKTCMLPWNGNPAGTVEVASRVLNAGALLACEGPNEPNNKPYFTYAGEFTENNARPIALFQKDMFAAIRANSAFNNIPIFASSDIAGAQLQNCRLQFLSLPQDWEYKPNQFLRAGTRFADYANCHNYVDKAGAAGVVDNCAWNAFNPLPNSDPYNGLYANYGLTWKNKYTGYSAAQLETLPKVCTENGWYTAKYDGHDYPIDQTRQGKLLLNTYLVGFKRKWKYTFVYQFRDQGAESYGIYTSGGEKKLAATYIHNFTTILQDPGSATPGALNYTIANKPSTTHDLLMQKSNGTFELVVWSELKTGSSSITVDLGATFPAVRVYDPTREPTLIKTLSNVRSVGLSVSDHPLIIEIPKATKLETYNPPNGSSGDSHVMDADANASGGSIANYHANGVGDYVTYAFPSTLAAGTYSVRVLFKEGPQRPKFQVAMALSGSGVWTNVGSEIDGYASAFTYTKFTVGNYSAPSSGIYKVRLTATGRNAAATGATWNMLIDYIELVKQ